MKWLIAVLSLLLATTTLSTCSYLQERDRAGQLDREAAQLRRERDAQTAINSRSAFLFNTFNRITAANEADRLRRDAVTADRVIEYREVLRNVPATDARIPDHVANGLCEKYRRLRADTLAAAPSEPDSADPYSGTACKLTYRQAVLWLEPLLNALDTANRKLADIRAADEARSTQPKE